MATRGRKSLASKEIKPITAVNRPNSPSELSKEQAIEWNAVVARLPADWFPRETHGLLIQYCRHVVNARTLSKQIEKFPAASLGKEDGLKRFDKLTAMHEREGRAASSLATRLRITQQTQRTPGSAATAVKKSGTSKKPWEFGE